LFFLALVAGLLACQKSCSDPDTYIILPWTLDLGYPARSPPDRCVSHTFAGADWIAKEWTVRSSIFYGAFAGRLARRRRSDRDVIADSFALLFPMAPEAALIDGPPSSSRPRLRLGNISMPPAASARFPFWILWTGGLVGGATRGSPPWRLVALMTPVG